ncbi:hypothetical protein M8C21_001806 [Ambrosia artemisiifolia]|uniref:Ataxin 2 SM domain-containing protein n=1 Tax=Ambrosia artemisiifolia TaxID=4212 RepID=A0AAD5BRI9_AMBAR|nr:hypothetical protein M8C21_001806 [Ambrosia artemisiifolia]
MNPQQVAQSRSSANGFTRRRGEKEMGNRLENKFQPGKSNNRMTTAGVQTGNKGGIDSPSHDRLVYLTTCLIGHQVEVQVIDGSLFTGIFHATNAEKDFGIILKMAHLTKPGSSREQKNISGSVQKPPSKTLIIPAKELVQIVAKSVPVTRDGLMNDLQNDQLHDIMIDSSISQSRHVDLERELKPWVPDDDIAECPELDNTFDRHWNRGWDQFEANAALFGERGIHFHDKFDLDEETKYSSVFRGVDDSGYDEDEDILDSQNSQTFGDASDSLPNKSQLTSSFPTSVEVQSSRLSTTDDFHPSGALDGASITENNQTNQQQAGSNHTNQDTEKHMVYDQKHTSQSKESSLLANKESTDKGPSTTVTASAPTKVSSKAQEKTCSGEVSSTSESGNAAPTAASGSRLSPSSSIGSLTSEKSTLNPNAKEFRLNPNAKSFVPSSAPLRPASPVSDASFYYPANVAPAPHMHGMPVGIGMGPAFPSHQPVIYGPQGTPLQPPPTYFHPNNPQYGQQMLLGQPRQVVYMPTYPPVRKLNLILFK